MPQIKMPQITSGRVVYSRTVQPAQYESKRAEVELAFVVEDGESAEDAVDAVDAVAKIVKRKALEIVGLRQRRER